MMPTSYESTAIQVLQKAQADALTAPAVDSVADWADQYRWISPGRKWSTDQTPYLRGVMDALSDPSVREVNLCFGSQCGKTESLFNFIGFIAHIQPALILYMSSTKELAQDAGRMRLDAMAYASPALIPIFGLERGKSTKVGTLSKGLKRFIGGAVKIASALSPSDTLSHPIPFVLCDEVDRYGPDREAIIQLAKARASTFPWSKLVCASTPYGETSMIIDRVKDSGDSRFLIPCPHCGEASEWLWSQVVHYGVGVPVHLCPACSGILRSGGAAPLELLRKGRWSSNTGVKRGFRLSSLYSPFLSLDELWREYEQARGSASSLLMSTFCRDRMAMEYYPHQWEFELAQADTGTANQPPPPPPKDAVRTVGIDVQHDRVEFSVIDRPREGVELWFFDHAVLPGDTSDGLIYTELAKYLRSLKPTICAIDAGDGTRMHYILKWVESMQGRLPIIATKGAHPWRKRDGQIARVSKGNPYNAPFIRYAAGHYKGLVQGLYQSGRFHGLEAAAHDAAFPSLQLMQYVRGLFAEREEPTRSGGTQWVVLGEYNEPLDCAAMACAAYDYAVATKMRMRHSQK